jgi:hypothetical protein
MTAASKASVAIRVRRACNLHEKLPENRRIVDMSRQSRKLPASSAVCSSLDEPAFGAKTSSRSSETHGFG